MNLKQRTASLFLAFFLTCTIPCFANATEPPIDTLQAPFFNDITDHWAESQIKAAVASGYVNGYEDGTFKPNASVTRAEFIKLLVGALKLDVETGSSPWYQGYVTAAKKAGIFADDFEGWNQPILRKEMAVLAVRAGLSGYKQEYDENRYLYEAAKGGILSGTAPGEIEPDGVSTRAQAVVVIERVLAVKSGKTLESDKYAVSAAEILWHKTNILTMLPRYFTNSSSEFNSQILSDTSPNGNVACTVNKFVVVDLNDKNDPNRKLVTDNDLVWGAGSNYFKLKDSGGYALISVNEVSLKGNPGADRINSCYVDVYNEDWYKMPQNATDPKNPNGFYGFAPWNSKYESLQFSIDVKGKSSGNFTYISGYLIPKGDLTSNKEFRVSFYGLGNWEGDVLPVYSSKLNEKYHQ